MSRLISFPAVAAVRDGARIVSFPVGLHEAVASARRRHRTLIAAAGQWALARGVPLPADDVALWAAAAGESGYPGDVDGVTGPWRASHMPDLVATVSAWCTLAGCAAPTNLAGSLWHLYGFLAASSRLHPASDSLHELRAAVVVFSDFHRFRPESLPPPEPTAA
jgi:hypothetical protein